MTRLTITSADNDGTRYQLLHDILEVYGFCNNLPVSFNGNDTLEIHDHFIESAADLVDIEGKPYDLTGIKLEFHADIMQDYEGEVSTTINRAMLVRDAYKAAYPSDYKNVDLTPNITLEDVVSMLEDGRDAFFELNVEDSVVRERVLDMVSVTCDIKYSYLYKLWLDS